METTNIVDFSRRDKMTDALTELLRTGAQNLIAQAVEAELSGYLAQFSESPIQKFMRYDSRLRGVGS